MFTHETDRRRIAYAADRGTVMIPVIATVLVLVAVGSSALIAGRANMKRAQIHLDSTQALQIAEAGVLRALDEVSANADLDSNATIGDVHGGFGGGTYDAVATTLQRGYYRVEARGVVDGVAREVEIIVRKGPAFAFTDALRTRAGTVLRGASFDSYDSRLGSYVSQQINGDLHGDYATENVRLSSNGTIDADQNSVIRGDVLLAPGQDLELEAGTYFSGTEYEVGAPFEVPPPSLEAFQAAHASNANGSWTASGPYTYSTSDMSLRVTAGTQLVLPPGTYFFSEIVLVGNSTILVSGETKIFVTGELDMAGGAVLNPTNEPKNLQVYAHPYGVGGIPAGDDLDIKLSGASIAAMAIYAPEYDVSRNGAAGEFFGAIVGKTADIQGIEYHYDEALSDEHGIVAPGREFIRVLSRATNPSID